MEFTTKGKTVLPLLDYRGKPYLQVAHRIQWFREEHQDWVILTEFPRLDDKTCICRADVHDSEGKIRARAHKREDTADFHDHMEKAETGAIGRALAMLGYGTQFCADELDEGSRLADSPIKIGRGVASNVTPIDKPAKKAPPAVEYVPPANSADFIIPYGKNAGKRIGDFPATDAKLSLEYWQKKLNGEKPNPKLEQYMIALTVYISEQSTAVIKPKTDSFDDIQF